MILAKEIDGFRKGNYLMGIWGHGGVITDPGLVLCCQSSNLIVSVYSEDYFIHAKQL